MNRTPNVAIDSEACTGCGKCVAMCPRSILVLDESGKCKVTDESKCDRLGGCERICPVRAIRIK